MDKQKKIFADGFRFELPSPELKQKAPWIKGKLSVKVAEAIKFLQEHESNAGWVNIDMKLSEKTGKIYLELNQWKPKEQLVGLKGEKISDNPFNE